MSIGLLLNQTCQISRNTAGSADVWGQPAESWDVVEGGVRCRIEGLSGREVREQLQGVSVSHNGYFLAGVDLHEADRVVVGTTSYEVLYVNTMPGGVANHVEAQLKELRT